MIQAQKTAKAGISAVRVDGWDSRCEVFVTDKTKERLRRAGGQFELLNARSTECYLVEALDGIPLLFIGFMPATLRRGAVYVWMIPFPALALRYLRDMRSMFDAHAKKYTKITAQILHSETANRRWLRFFGFKDILCEHGLVAYERIS